MYTVDVFFDHFDPFLVYGILEFQDASCAEEVSLAARDGKKRLESTNNWRSVLASRFCKLAARICGYSNQI